VVLLGALFRLTSIKLICGQQNSQLGNNWATNISKKVELGNKKEKEKCTETQQKQALNKQKKVNYFPIQKVTNCSKPFIYNRFQGIDIFKVQIRYSIIQKIHFLGLKGLYFPVREIGNFPFSISAFQFPKLRAVVMLFLKWFQSY
jgi:hypothetical protein